MCHLFWAEQQLSIHPWQAIVEHQIPRETKMAKMQIHFTIWVFCKGYQKNIKKQDIIVLSNLQLVKKVILEYLKKVEEAKFV